jgi:hypothetical protein
MALDFEESRQGHFAISTASSTLSACVLLFAFRKDLPFDQGRVHIDYPVNAERAQPNLRRERSSQQPDAIAPLYRYFFF